jgi:hypothetical protein
VSLATIFPFVLPEGIYPATIIEELLVIRADYLRICPILCIAIWDILQRKTYYAGFSLACRFFMT